MSKDQEIPNPLTSRVSWGSRIGFVFAVAGSAVGLANIWRFPYIVGQNGGAAFIVVYLLCLLFIGFPVFISEIIIGRSTCLSPSGAFRQIGGASWSWAGKLTIATGFLVSAFYSAVAGWILGYLIEAVGGKISSFSAIADARAHHQSVMENPLWGLSFHFSFLLICTLVLLMGVRGGIERGNKIMMPLLFIMLIFLASFGLMMPNAGVGLTYLLNPNWSALTPQAFLMALGQAFFTLSLGQGTMVTYGSYLKKNENLMASCVPVVLMDTCVSLLSAIAVFTIVFSVGIEPNAGPGLIFHTLPWVFSQIPSGHLLAVAFFLLVLMAALTSEISAMEPTIAYLIDDWGWKRTPAVLCCGTFAFLLGVPAALSYSVLKNTTISGMAIVDVMDFLTTGILIPLGGFLAVVLVGWRWGIPQLLHHMGQGFPNLFEKYRWLIYYFWFCIKFSAPILIILVFLNAFGIF